MIALAEDRQLWSVLFVILRAFPIAAPQRLGDTGIELRYRALKLPAHIRISSGRSFVEGRRKLEGTVPKRDSGIAEALRSGDRKRAKDYEENGPKLSIFGERDHGALLQIVGNRRNAVQYEIGNPLTASKMTRHQLPAALYAPLRVVLFEDSHGRGIFEYERPSSFFSQYGDERVTEVGRYLDATLEAVLRNAAD